MQNNSIFLKLHNDDDYIAAFYGGLIGIDDVPRHLRGTMDFYIDYFLVNPLNYFSLPLRERMNISVSRYGLEILLENYSLEQVMEYIEKGENSKEYLDICNMIIREILEN